VLAILATAPLSWSQESRGTILGASPTAPIRSSPACLFKSRNVATNVTTRVTTNAEGIYVSSYLIQVPIGLRLRRKASNAWFGTVCDLVVNARLEMDLTLEIGAVAETLTVTAEAPLLDTTSASLGRVVSVEEARSLL